MVISPALPSDLMTRAFCEAATTLQGGDPAIDPASFGIALEGAVMAGNSAFDLIAAHDTAWHSAMFRGALNYSEADEQAIVERYRSWGEVVEGLIRVVETVGRPIEGAEGLRDRLREVRGLLTPDAEFFEGEALDRLASEAIAADERGETVAFTEMGE